MDLGPLIWILLPINTFTHCIWKLLQNSTKFEFSLLSLNSTSSNYSSSFRLDFIPDTKTGHSYHLKVYLLERFIIVQVITVITERVVLSWRRCGQLIAALHNFLQYRETSRSE